MNFFVRRLKENVQSCLREGSYAFKSRTIVKPKPIDATEVRTHDINVRSTLIRLRNQAK
jgi:hypothetical protein